MDYNRWMKDTCFYLTTGIVLSFIIYLLTDHAILHTMMAGGKVFGQGS